jgi:hypothetical protein
MLMVFAVYRAEIRNTGVTRVTLMKRRFAVSIVSIALGLGGLTFANAGASTKTVGASGGSVTFRATVRNATSCRWSSSPKIAGFATTVRCKTGTVARSAKFQANASTKTKSYAITLTAHGKMSTIIHWEVIQAGHSTTTTTTTTTTVPPTTTTTTPGGSPAPIDFSGIGQTVASDFTVEGGLAVFHAMCSACHVGFIMEIDHADGSLVDTPISVSGSYNGSVAEGMSAGQYILVVRADPGAPGTVEITQPRGVAGTALPTTFTGEGQEVVGPVVDVPDLWFEATNTSSHDGNFIVEIFGADGSIQGEPIDVIGSYSGFTIANFLRNGPYYLAITSDGAWSIALSAI